MEHYKQALAEQVHIVGLHMPIDQACKYQPYV